MCPIVCPAGVFKHSDNFKFELESWLELQDNLAKPLMITKSSPQSFRLIARNYLNKRTSLHSELALEPHPVGAIHRDARGRLLYWLLIGLLGFRYLRRSCSHGRQFIHSLAWWCTFPLSRTNPPRELPRIIAVRLPFPSSRRRFREH